MTSHQLLYHGVLTSDCVFDVRLCICSNFFENFFRNFSDDVNGCLGYVTHKSTHLCMPIHLIKPRRPEIVLNYGSYGSFFAPLGAGIARLGSCRFVFSSPSSNCWRGRIPLFWDAFKVLFCASQGRSCSGFPFFVSQDMEVVSFGRVLSLSGPMFTSVHYRVPTES